jgi:hypothetical protein
VSATPALAQDLSTARCLARSDRLAGNRGAGGLETRRSKKSRRRFEELGFDHSWLRRRLFEIADERTERRGLQVRRPSDRPWRLTYREILENARRRLDGESPIHEAPAETAVPSAAFIDKAPLDSSSTPQEAPGLTISPPAENMDLEGSSLRNASNL